MNPHILNMLIVAGGFSWPVVLAFAGTVTTFQVFIGTATSGVIYFAIRALLGYVEVGTISLAPTIIIAVCGVMNAIGIEKYVPLLATPKYAGGALALTNMMVVYGTTAVVAFYLQQQTSLSFMNIAGGIVVGVGTIMLTWK